VSAPRARARRPRAARSARAGVACAAWVAGRARRAGGGITARTLQRARAELERAGLWRAEYESAEQEWFQQAVDLVRQRFFTLEDFSRRGRAYFAETFPFEEAAVQKNLAKEPRLKELLPALAGKMEEVEPFNAETAEAALRAFAEEAGVKAGLLQLAAE